MIKLFTEEDFNNAKSTDKLPLQCENCGKTFFMYKKMITHIENHHKTGQGCFCCMKCSQHFRAKGKFVYVNCEHCNKDIKVIKSLFEKSKSKHFFCSKSCAAYYNNTHKSYGFSRSKLELYLEEKLTELYPSLNILYNDRKTINSELDIYIPKHKLAFELNGIVHYEPIYGKNTLEYIQNRDKNKFQMCQENNISLCVIDTSSLKYFKEQRAEKYLNIIVGIINQHQLTD